MIYRNQNIKLLNKMAEFLAEKTGNSVMVIELDAQGCEPSYISSNEVTYHDILLAHRAVR